MTRMLSIHADSGLQATRPNASHLRQSGVLLEDIRPAVPARGSRPRELQERHLRKAQSDPGSSPRVGLRE